MDRAPYLKDAYLRECASEVAQVDPDGLVLNTTVFYPAGGGQPGDSGVLEGPGGKRWMVTSTEHRGTEILHRIEGTERPTVGTPLRGRIDWARRYQHMRFHTALHILSGVAFRQFGAGITGGQIYDDRARMDFPLPEFDRAVAEQILSEVNRVVGERRPVRVRFVSRSAFESDPSLVRVEPGLLPDVDEVRLIDIEGFDIQADGGTHVASTAEVGRVVLERIENKGARNKRLYIQCPDPARDSG